VHLRLILLEAGVGATPEATDLNQWFLSAAETTYLSVARERLVNLLERGAREGFPETAAEAQTSFVCWVELIEEGHQRIHIDACQQDFMVATARLEEQLVRKVSICSSSMILTISSRKAERR
jgi:hypothetical protein